MDFTSCSPANPASHATLFQWVAGLEAGRQLHPLKLRVKGKANRWEHHLYRWANGVPLTDSDDALQVNWCQLTITDAQGTVRYRNSYITDWAISADNVAGRLTAGRARWKIENESNNVLQEPGLSPGTQLRARQKAPVLAAGDDEPAGLQAAHAAGIGR